MDIQYCLECNNILYPRYENNILQLVCNKCNVVIDCNTYIIFNRYKNKNIENKNKKYFVNDVTLPKLCKICEKCKNDNCVSYITKSEVKALDTHYICTSCLYEWCDKID